jgi:small subunit ribosomal protein S6
MSPATATKTAEYELVLMLDPETEEERRNEIAANARKRIEDAATLKGERAWGMRKLAYEIRQRTEADYRYFRFEGSSPLLEDLDHNLKITDGVLRFRIFKVEPDSPMIEPPPPVPLASATSRPAGRRPGGPRSRAEQAPPEVTEEPPIEEPAAPAEEPAPAAEGPEPVEQPPAAEGEQAEAEVPPAADEDSA